jgi:hypothetical protein
MTGADSEPIIADPRPARVSEPQRKTLRRISG